jgi:hypothetical protein
MKVSIRVEGEGYFQVEVFEQGSRGAIPGGVKGVSPDLPSPRRVRGRTKNLYLKGGRV